jgi:hypothetical protein
VCDLPYVGYMGGSSSRFCSGTCNDLLVNASATCAMGSAADQTIGAYFNGALSTCTPCGVARSTIADGASSASGPWPYFSYSGSLAVSGSVGPVTSNGTTQSFPYALSGVDPACASGAGTAANSCGIYIHTGMTCTADAGGHYFTSPVVADPWTSISYTSATGDAMGYVWGVTTGGRSGDIVGRAVVVHGYDGGRIACALLAADGCDIGDDDNFDASRFCADPCNAALKTAEIECATEDPETATASGGALGWCTSCGLAYSTMLAPDPGCDLMHYQGGPSSAFCFGTCNAALTNASATCSGPALLGDTPEANISQTAGYLLSTCSPPSPSMLPFPPSPPSPPSAPRPYVGALTGCPSTSIPLLAADARVSCTAQC